MGRSVFPPPNATCDFHRIALSISLLGRFHTSSAFTRLLSVASSIPLASFSGLDGKGNCRPSPFSPVAFIPIAGHLYPRDRVEWLPPTLDHYSQTLGTMTTPHPYRSVGCPLLTWVGCPVLPMNQSCDGGRCPVRRFVPLIVAMPGRKDRGSIVPIASTPWSSVPANVRCRRPKIHGVWDSSSGAFTLPILP